MITIKRVRRVTNPCWGFFLSIIYICLALTSIFAEGGDLFIGSLFLENTA